MFESDKLIMILQLPSGRIIEISVEQYLALSDEEIQELNGLSSAYTMEISNPFHRSYASTAREQAFEDMKEHIEEREPALDEFTETDKLEDEYFHSDDI